MILEFSVKNFLSFKEKVTFISILGMFLTLFGVIISELRRNKIFNK